jgi:pre-rRNA-processing protein TSR3
MQSFLPTFILRHQRENLKKCSLRGLEVRADCRFFTYPKSAIPDTTNYLLLAMDAPPLRAEDANKGLFLLDATWRYASKMLNFVESKAIIEKRSIPAGFRTAYPRRQDDCPNPEEGLASIEALYIAYVITGRDPVGLLDNYYWREAFLEKNKALFAEIDRNHH